MDAQVFEVHENQVALSNHIDGHGPESWRKGNAFRAMTVCLIPVIMFRKDFLRLVSCYFGDCFRYVRMVLAGVEGFCLRAQDEQAYRRA